MKAIELNSKTDKRGHLTIDYPLDITDMAVRVIILLDDKTSKINEEKIWLEAVSKNPDFDFLNDKEEDIYSVQDGEPFNG